MPRDGYYAAPQDNITRGGRQNLWPGSTSDPIRNLPIVNIDNINNPGVFRDWGQTMQCGVVNYQAGTWAQIVRIYNAPPGANAEIVGNQGTADAINSLMTEVRRLYGGTWVAGHLLNADLGGPNQRYNLFPITSQDNGSQRQWDNVAKRLLYCRNSAVQYVNTAEVWKVAYRVHIAYGGNQYSIACSIGIKRRGAPLDQWMTRGEVNANYNLLFTGLPPADMAILTGQNGLIT